MDGEKEHPFFGKADAIYNVIDSRQNDPQNNVRLALQGMGYTEAAAHYTHMNYEMVALTPDGVAAGCLGYTLSEEDKGRFGPYIEVSGRKGFGVKADDLLDKLIAAARAEAGLRGIRIRQRRRSWRRRRWIAIPERCGTFMLKFTQEQRDRVRLPRCVEL